MYTQAGLSSLWKAAIFVLYNEAVLFMPLRRNMYPYDSDVRKSEKKIASREGKSAI